MPLYLCPLSNPTSTTRHTMHEPYVQYIYFDFKNLQCKRTCNLVAHALTHGAHICSSSGLGLAWSCFWLCICCGGQRFGGTSMWVKPTRWNIVHPRHEWGMRWSTQTISSIVTFLFVIENLKVLPQIRDLMQGLMIAKQCVNLHITWCAWPCGLLAQSNEFNFRYSRHPPIRPNELNE